eukprot:31194-Pelagococcus_subviridis.AAC.25
MVIVPPASTPGNASALFFPPPPIQSFGYAAIAAAAAAAAAPESHPSLACLDALPRFPPPPTRDGSEMATTLCSDHMCEIKSFCVEKRTPWPQCEQFRALGFSTSGAASFAPPPGESSSSSSSSASASRRARAPLLAATTAFSLRSRMRC